MHVNKLLVSALICVALAAPAFGQNLRLTKKQLRQENARLRTQLDSLRIDLEKYRNDSRLNDSIVSELRDIYENNAQRSAAGLNPEDYTPEITDSLLSIWYLHRQIGRSSEGQEYDMDSVHFQSDVPDKVYIERLEAMNSFITLPFNETVRNYIILYSEKMPTKMGHILGLCRYYMPIFEEVFNKYDMPLELKYMAVIESALNPVAVSRAGAKGMWQFMYKTARDYGLEINSYVDERLDPVASADAAARFLSDSYAIFGDWNLAISSYNCGAGNVNKAIRRSGGKRDFWSIYPYLPRETRGYVPAFVGAMYAIRYYKEHGLVPEVVPMPEHTDTFRVHKQLHFKQVNALAGVPMDDLHNLNPQYMHDIVPGASQEYILRIPYQYTNAYIEHEDSLYTYMADSLFKPATLKAIESGRAAGSGRITYKVKSGDYLGRIASRYHVSINQIKQWNHLRSNNLRVGQILYIYGRGSEPASQASSTSKSAKSSKSSDSTSSSGSTGSGYTVYTVKKGDSLYKIAAKYPGVSAQDIMKLNGISSSIRAGQKIKIPNR